MPVDTLSQLRLMRVSAVGDNATALDAAIARYELPVIATCSECSWHRVGARGYPHCTKAAPDEDGIHYRALADATPPSWCPLREPC